MLCCAHTVPIPIAAHPSLFLQVMYGGRAIDDFDRRVLRIYMDEYMGDFIFDTFQPFHFYHNAEVDYVIPPDGQRDDYLEAIDGLPLANTPEVFGLHANAEIGYFTTAAKEMWAQLVELQPQTGETGGGISREEFIGTIASDIQVKRTVHPSACLPPPSLTFSSSPSSSIFPSHLTYMASDCCQKKMLLFFSSLLGQTS